MEEREGISVIEDVRRITQETSYRDLINLSDEELARRFDLLLFVGYHEITIDHCRDEIQRRELAKQSQRLERLTWALVALTMPENLAEGLTDAEREWARAVLLDNDFLTAGELATFPWQSLFSIAWERLARWEETGDARE